jgi:hypothetical protein
VPRRLRSHVLRRLRSHVLRRLRSHGRHVVQVLYFRRGSHSPGRRHRRSPS